MEVIAFVGSSGTGKSHRALVVAHENNIECIIDDGILIHDNKIVAGFSAKKESSRLKAVRRAIFQDEVQVKSVREQLDKINPNKLMIIGTSNNMVKKITKALGLQDPDRYIRIEDVATPKEIEKLLLHCAGELAKDRKNRGIKLNFVESTALISSELLELAREGKSVPDLMNLGTKILTKEDVMEGVAEVLHEVQIEATFPDGTKLVTVHNPIQ